MQVLDEQLTDLLRCLPDNPAMHERVLDAVFSLARTSSAATAAAALEAPGAPIPVQVRRRPACQTLLLWLLAAAWRSIGRLLAIVEGGRAPAWRMQAALP